MTRKPRIGNIFGIVINRMMDHTPVPDADIDQKGESMSWTRMISRLNFGRIAICVCANALIMSQVACASDDVKPDKRTFQDSVARPDHLGERLDDATLRIPMLDNMPVQLGQCSTRNGGLRQQLCIDQTQPINYELVIPAKEDGALPHPSSLNMGGYSNYTVTKSWDITGEFSASYLVLDAETNVGVTYRRFQWIAEWTRYRRQSLTIDGEKRLDPHVNAVDVGIGVRIIFDIKMKLLKADGKLSFGLGSVSTALEKKNAEVLVSYQIIGTTVDILPERAPTSIQDAGEFAVAQEKFHDAIRIIKQKWDEYAWKTCKAAEESPTGVSSENVSRTNYKEVFKPEIIAYYIYSMQNPVLNAAYAMGYLRALNRMQNSDYSCRETMNEYIGTNNSVNERQLNMQQGINEAYLAVMGTDRCTDAKPTAEQKEKAKAIVEEAKK